VRILIEYLKRFGNNKPATEFIAQGNVFLTNGNTRLILNAKEMAYQTQSKQQQIDQISC
jgi:uncharacterized membrane protein